jgi:hypothetical protein
MSGEYSIENALHVVTGLEEVFAVLKGLDLSSDNITNVVTAALDATERYLPVGSVPAISELLISLKLHRETLIQDVKSRAEVTRVVESLASDLREQLESMRPKEADRVTLITYLAGATSAARYLEIGCCNDACFSAVSVPHKVGVDPRSGGTLRMTSDEYFARHREQFDLIFIDGLHECRQVARDIENALKILAPRGYIVMHDCNPRYEIRQITPAVTGVWNGDVWKAYVHYRQQPDLESIVADFDHGCGIIRRGKNPAPIRLGGPFPELTWAELAANRARWLPLQSFTGVKDWLQPQA